MAGCLFGKVSIVAGATRGIGRATAELFAQAGAALLLIGRSGDELEQASSDIRTQGGRAAVFKGDVGNPADVAAAVDRALELFGHLDVLVNNAAAHQEMKDIESVAEGEFDEIVRTTLKGTWLMCKYAIRAMKRNGGGSIVNTASQWGMYGVSQQSAYCAAKGGVIALTRALAIETATEGIRVNCICPGYTDTEHAREWFATLPDAERVRAQLLSRIPLGRPASPREVAQASLYLASDNAMFVTGQVLAIDGGYTAQ